MPASEHSSTGMTIVANGSVSLDLARSLQSQLNENDGFCVPPPQQRADATTSLGVAELIITLVLARLGKAAALTALDEIERFLVTKVSQGKLQDDVDCQIVVEGERPSRTAGRFPFRISNHGALAIKTAFNAIRDVIGKI